MSEAKNVKQCKSCKGLGDISPEARAFLHYHNKLDHMGFNKLKDLASDGYIQSKITKAEKVICAEYQIGKARLNSEEKASIVVKD